MPEFDAVASALLQASAKGLAGEIRETVADAVRGGAFQTPSVVEYALDPVSKAAYLKRGRIMRGNWGNEKMSFVDYANAARCVEQMKEIKATYFIHERPNLEGKNSKGQPLTVTHKTTATVR